MFINYKEYDLILNKCILLAQFFRRSARLVGAYESYGLQREKKFYSLAYDHAGYVNMCKAILEDYQVIILKLI